MINTVDPYKVATDSMKAQSVRDSLHVVVTHYEPGPRSLWQKLTGQKFVRGYYFRGYIQTPTGGVYPFESPPSTEPPRPLRVAIELQRAINATLIVIEDERLNSTGTSSIVAPLDYPTDVDL